MRSAGRAAISIGGPVIGGRERGGAWRERIASFIQSRPPDAITAIDFKNVETMDFSAADEMLTPLVARVVSGELGSKRFYLCGLNDSVRETAAAVFELRKKQVVELKRGSFEVIGPLSPPHRETFAFVASATEVTVADVARRFWKTPNMTAATNRLNTLAAAGLIYRVLQPGGRRGARFVYRPFASPGSLRKRRMTSKHTNFRSANL